MEDFYYRSILFDSGTIVHLLFIHQWYKLVLRGNTTSIFVYWGNIDIYKYSQHLRVFEMKYRNILIYLVPSWQHGPSGVDIWITRYSNRRQHTNYVTCMIIVHTSGLSQRNLYTWMVPLQFPWILWMCTEKIAMSYNW